MALAPTKGWILCLCAQWCHVCRAFKPQLEALAAREPQWSFVWLDVEDEEDLLGDFEVETFPMLIMGLANELRFVGPIQPRVDVLARLAQGVLGEDGTPVADAQALAVLQDVVRSRA